MKRIKKLFGFLLPLCAAGLLSGNVELLKRAFVERDPIKGKALFYQLPSNYFFKQFLNPALNQKERADLVREWRYTQSLCTRDPESIGTFAGDGNDHSLLMSFNAHRIKSLVCDPRVAFSTKCSFERADPYWLLWMFDKDAQECLFHHLRLVFFGTQVMRIFKAQTQWLFAPWWVPQGAKDRYADLVKELSPFDDPNKLNSPDFRKKYAELIKIFELSEKKEALENKIYEKEIQLLKLKIERASIFDIKGFLNLGRIKAAPEIKSSFVSRAFNRIIGFFSSFGLVLKKCRT
jgi:hypothetical protein